LEQFRAYSDGGFFRSSFPAGSGYCNFPESHILPIYPYMHQICSRPQSPTRTYTSTSRIPRPLFPSFQRETSIAAQIPITQRPPTHAEDIAEYRREYAALGHDFHQDMTLVEYCGLRLRNHPREPQRHNSSNRGITLTSSEKLVNSPYLLLTDHPDALPELGYRN
jgi:hypothetical protein